MDSFNCEENVKKVVNDLKSNGTFDKVRRECLSDIDTKPSYRNLIQRVEGCLTKFLSRQIWSSNLSKNQLRNQLRNEINSSEVLRKGITHLVDQVISEKTTNLFKNEIKAFFDDQLGIKDEAKDEEEEPQAQVDQEEQEEASKDVNIMVEDMDIADSNDSNDSNNPASLIIQNEPSQTSQEARSIHFEELETSPVSVNTPEDPLDLNDQPPANSSEPDPILEAKQEELNELQQIDTPEDASIKNVGDNDDELQDSLDSYDLDDFAPTEKVEAQVCNKQEIKAEDKLEDANPAAEVPETKANLLETEIKEEEASDISSVHTSDLSDFDDEISLDDSEEEEEINSKKKISLKVMKKIYETTIQPAQEDDCQDSDSKTDGKRKLDSIEEDPSTKKIKSEPDDVETSNAGNTCMQVKLKRTNSIAKQQRYDSSDLYKPRHSLSSRRSRSNVDRSTPESTSTNDD